MQVLCDYKDITFVTLSEDSEPFCLSTLNKYATKLTTQNNPLPTLSKKTQTLYYYDISMKLLLVFIKTEQYTFNFYIFILLH